MANWVESAADAQVRACLDNHRSFALIAGAGSGYPHNIGDMIGCLSRVDALGGETRHLVRGRNAERIFKL